MRWFSYSTVFPAATYRKPKFMFDVYLPGNKVWVRINQGKFEGSVGVLSLPLTPESMYNKYGHLIPTRSHIVAEGKKIPIVISGGDVWTSCEIAILPKNSTDLKEIYKRKPSVKETIPQIYDHFGEEILPGKVIMVARYGSTEFGIVTKILSSGSFRYKGIRTRIDGNTPSEDACYTMSNTDVVVIENNMLDKVLMKKLSL